MGDSISKEELESFINNQIDEIKKDSHKGQLSQKYLEGKLQMLKCMRNELLEVKSYEVVIKTSMGEWNIWFRETCTVERIIEQTRCRFGYVEGGNYEIAYKGCKLSNECTFEGVNLKDGDTLHFSDLGGSV